MLLCQRQMASVEEAASFLRQRLPHLAQEWADRRPFRYVVIDDFLPQSFAEAILEAYPSPDPRFWDATTYVHQRRKFVLTAGFPEPIGRFFEMTESEPFRALVSAVTGIPGLVSDPSLLGGGLHQIANGGFLDVHVDFNLHPRTKLYRRLNLLLYMNKNWDSGYGGDLEFWDMSTRQRLESVAPVFNRAVLFETNGLSYHGHPQPLVTPAGVTRKSLAIYYYSEQPGEAVGPERNTLYRQTTGLAGYSKTLWSAMLAAAERFRAGGLREVAKIIARKADRKLQGLPPENR